MKNRKIIQALTLIVVMLIGFLSEVIIVSAYVYPLNPEPVKKDPCQPDKKPCLPDKKPNDRDNFYNRFTKCVKGLGIWFAETAYGTFGLVRDVFASHGYNIAREAALDTGHTQTLNALKGSQLEAAEYRMSAIKYAVTHPIQTAGAIGNQIKTGWRGLPYNPNAEEDVVGFTMDVGLATASAIETGKGIVRLARALAPGKAVLSFSDDIAGYADDVARSADDVCCPPSQSTTTPGQLPTSPSGPPGFTRRLMTRFRTARSPSKFIEQVEKMSKYEGALDIYEARAVWEYARRTPELAPYLRAGPRDLMGLHPPGRHLHIKGAHIQIQKP